MSNNLLTFNLMSEPRYIVDRETGDNINDGYFTHTWWSIQPEGYTPEVEDFNNPYSLINTYPYLFTMAFIFLSVIITYLKQPPKCMQIFFYSMSLLYVTISTVNYIFDYNRDLTVCDIPYQCMDGGNNTIDYSTNYYISNDPDCYSLSYMGYDYADNFREEPREWDCKTSTHGCCSIDVKCYNSIKGDYGWDYYQKMIEYDRGYMTFPLQKKDGVGSNCPEITELINYKLHTEKVKGTYVYQVAVLFTLVLLITNCVCGYFDEKVETKYMVTDADVTNP